MKEKEETWVEEVKSLRSKELHPSSILNRYEIRIPMMGSTVYCTICARFIIDGQIATVGELIREVLIHERTNHAGH